MAGLCHDLGHLPFSHATEGLLPDGEDHESVTKRLIESEHISSILGSLESGPIRPDDVIAIATETANLEPWKQLLAEIIQSPFFGVDRIDYLLRDSWHAGVAYGRFDHFRLLDTLRILPPAPADDVPDATSDEVGAPSLGVERGGLESAEALALARYFMFSQVYLHKVRQIYDIHLGDFLRGWLPDGIFPTEPDALLELTDNEVVVGLRTVASGDKDHPAFDPADRILRRKHFKPLYEPSRADYEINLEPGAAIFEAAKEVLGDKDVRRGYYPAKSVPMEFSVLVKDRVEAASSHLEVLTNVPPVRLDVVYVAPNRLEEAERWLARNKKHELETRGEREDDEQT
jgi:HD superfamily phosphohydrolase